jgi:hypothetical protein
MGKMHLIILLLISLISCGRATGKSAESADSDTASEVVVPAFNADSAMLYLRAQMAYGPRIPNTEAHRLTADMLVNRLRGFGAEVVEQKMDLKAFDGNLLHARNIFAQYYPERERRVLLLAHYDTRPWADEDPSAENRSKPVPGANDGASGVAVLLEAARVIQSADPGIGVDILFVDAEDYGTDGDDDTWAMGTAYFAANPPIEGYAPDAAILLDMVGGKDAHFPPEYFSVRAASSVDAAFRRAAKKAGHGDLFSGSVAGAVTDDHVKLIERGIPAIDIIDYRSGEGFPPTWHTVADNLENISVETIKAVGETLLRYLYDRE